MSHSRTPAKFFSPLAIGAPEPMTVKPTRVERMIHFIPPHNAK
ncbi:MAG: CoA ester lyase, partial [Pseudomonadota bacterium]